MKDPRGDVAAIGARGDGLEQRRRFYLDRVALVGADEIVGWVGAVHGESWVSCRVGLEREALLVVAGDDVLNFS